jgi:hypothetical protein
MLKVNWRLLIEMKREDPVFAQTFNGQKREKPLPNIFSVYNVNVVSAGSLLQLRHGGFYLRGYRSGVGGLLWFTIYVAEPRSN